MRTGTGCLIRSDRCLVPKTSCKGKTRVCLQRSDGEVQVKGWRGNVELTGGFNTSLVLKEGGSKGSRCSHHVGRGYCQGQVG